MRDTEAILRDIRRHQVYMDQSPPIRFVLETNNNNVGRNELEQSARQLLNQTVTVESLFTATQDNSDLGRFYLLKVKIGQVEFSSAEYFQISYKILDELALRSCEPVLETDFAHEGNADAEAEASLGGVIGCLVDKVPPADFEWALQTIRVPDAWNVPVPADGRNQGEGILIGQIDTGVNDHTELDTDAMDIRSGANFIEGGAAKPIDPLVSEGPADNPGHGIATASVAISRNLANITGTAPKAKMLPVRAIRSVIRLTQDTVAQGIEYARQQGVHVITMSLGGLPNFALQAAIRRAVQDNIIVLAAAGNCVRTVTYPARYRDCIAIAGINIDDQPWIGSCRGRTVDVSAPGELVHHARRNSPNASETETGAGQGTSFAVALTAGVAALWLAHFDRQKLIDSLNPGETLQERFRAHLKNTARIPNNWNFNFGAGIVNAEELLKADALNSPTTELNLHLSGERDEIESEIGALVAESTGMRPDDLGMSLTERLRFGLELAAITLSTAGRQNFTSETSVNNARTSLSLDLISVLQDNVSGSLRQLSRTNRYSTAPAAKPITITSSTIANPNISTSQQGDPITSVSNTDQDQENQLIFDPPGVGKLRYGQRVILTTERANLQDSCLQKGYHPVSGKPRLIHESPLNSRIESIIGVADDRIRIRQTTIDPWRRICSLEITGPLGSGTGTGWLVGPKTIITAGHCVHDRRMGGWAERIRIIPGRDNHLEPFPQAVTTATRFSSVKRWVNFADAGYDFGAIHLDEPIGNIVGWFGFASLARDTLRQHTVNVAGYAGDFKFEGRKLAFHSGQVLQVDDRRIYYDADTMPGQSGAPVWIYTTENPDEPIVVGIHAYSEFATPSHFQIEANSAPRLLPEVFEIIENWIAHD